MNTIDNKKIDNRVKELLLIINSEISIREKPGRKNQPRHESAKKNTLAMCSNIISQSIKELIELAKYAKNNEMQIPTELSYWMIDYVINDFEGGKTESKIKKAQQHNEDADDISDFMGLSMLINEICRGFEKGFNDKNKGLELKYKENLHIDILNASVENFTPYHYGYLVAQTEKKLTVVNAKLYMEGQSNMNEPKVKRLFIKYELNNPIHKTNAKLKIAFP